MGVQESMAVPLCLLEDDYAIVQLDPNDPIPDWAMMGQIWSIVRTDEELSIVCRMDQVPAGYRSEGDWRMIKVMGPLDFSLVGILAGITRVLASVEVSIFAISTFNTDYVLVKNKRVNAALDALKLAGYPVSGG